MAARLGRVIFKAKQRLIKTSVDQTPLWGLAQCCSRQTLVIDEQTGLPYLKSKYNFRQSIFELPNSWLS
jgi:hypothetical protein